MVASSGAQLLEDDAVETLIERLFPLATVVTPNLAEAETLAGMKQQTVTKSELAERIHALGAAAVIVTGGHGEPVDHLFDGGEHVEIPIERLDAGATHGAGARTRPRSAPVWPVACPSRGGGERGARGERRRRAWARRPRHGRRTSGRLRLRGGS
jgi:hypothetical protein